MWIGYISRTLFHTSKGTTYNGWYSEKQTLEIPDGLPADGSDNDTVIHGYSSTVFSGTGVASIFLNGSAAAGNWAGISRVLWATYIYDEKQESLPQAIALINTLSSVTANQYQVGVKVRPGITNKRISGIKIYVSLGSGGAIQSGSLAGLKLLAICDFKKDGGIWLTKETESGEVGAWTTNAAGATDLVVCVTSEWTTSFDDHLITYEINNPAVYDYVDSYNDRYMKYKTVTVAAQKAYIGNVKRMDKVYADIVIPSPVGKYDVFRYNDRLEIVPEDGDSVVKVESLGEKVLVFKKRTLYILDVSGEFEVVESENKYRGVTIPSAVTRVENGIAWINEYGCFYYDGTNIYDLLLDQADPTRRKIQLEYWRKFSGSDASVGYSAVDKRLFVSDLMNTNSTGVGVTLLAYNFDTLGWTRLQGKLNNGENNQKYSNFVTDWNGQLITFQTNTDEQVYKFNWSASVTSTTSYVYMKSKELVFDNPGLKKNLYAVHVMHKNSGGGVRLQYVKDGTSTVYAMTPTYLPDSTSPVSTRFVPANSTDAKNFKTLTLIATNSTGTVGNSFEIDNIEIVYREKGLR
jgi:hypothetical protein